MEIDSSLLACRFHDKSINNEKPSQLQQKKYNLDPKKTHYRLLA